MLHRIRIRLGIWDRFSRLSGWRKSAVVNTILVSIVFLVLTLSHVVLLARSGDPTGYHVIHSGSCAGDSVGRLNTVLHLLINILSSLVLASTNFFMQVLNAPSREELDSAHGQGSWLDIGVPSPRNVFRVSLFKTTMWILFFLSSIPIHLLFNSVIFSTDNRGGLFSYLVFDESILTGGSAFDPGTSLSVPLSGDFYSGNYSWDTRTWENLTSLDIAMQDYSESVYPDTSQSVDRTVEEIQNGGWHNLSKNDCISLYNTSSCSGIQSYRNVALILRGSSGWNRSQVWDLPTNESSFWDAYLPKDVNNSLWSSYSAEHSDYHCSMQLILGIEGTDRLYCGNDCSQEMGLRGRPGNSDMWNYDLFSNTRSRQVELASTKPAPEFRNSSLSVEYCLAEPVERTCQLGLASTLLWVVSLWYVPYLAEWQRFCKQGLVATNMYYFLSVLLKAVLCFVVITKLRKDTSLVTLGDVIESYISHPPDYFLGSCIKESHSQSHQIGIGYLLVLRPRIWGSKQHRRWRAIPRRVWLTSYSISSLGIGLLIYFFFIAYESFEW